MRRAETLKITVSVPSAFESRPVESTCAKTPSLSGVRQARSPQDRVRPIAQPRSTGTRRAHIRQLARRAWPSEISGATGLCRSNCHFEIFHSVSFRWSSLLDLSKGYTERMSQGDLVVVQSYGTEAEAEVAKSVLESSGIDAMIQADTAGRMREHLAWSGLGHRVLVREEDAAAARSLLALPQNDELVLLQKYATETKVDILQGALLSAGIFATVRDDGTYYQLLVNKEDSATARKVLETLSEARRP